MIVRYLILLLTILLILTGCNQTNGSLDSHDELSESTVFASRLEPKLSSEEDIIFPSQSESEFSYEEDIPSSIGSDTSTNLYDLKKYHNQTLKDLQKAFKSGDYKSFLEQQSLPDMAFDLETTEMVYLWPEQLEGVTAAFDFNIDEFDSQAENAQQNGVFYNINLEVATGNNHVPIGHQTVIIELRNAYYWDDNIEPVIYLQSMFINTDGRFFYSFYDNSDLDDFEKRIYYITDRLDLLGQGPVEATISFLNIFTPQPEWQYIEGHYTHDDIVKGAKKYLDISNFAPYEDTMYFSDGTYQWPGIGLEGAPSYSQLILETATEGDITCRVYVYQDIFLLSIAHTTDYNYKIRIGDSGEKYAQLLSVTDV